MPALDESDYISSSGEEEDTRDAAAREAANERQQADDAPAASPTPSPPPQRANSVRQKRGDPTFQDKNGAPICFFFGPGVQQHSKEGLTRHIRDRGGKVVLTNKEADTVLIGPKHSERDLQAMRDSYCTSVDPTLRKIMVEKTSFVKDCIDSGKVRHKRKRKTKQGESELNGRTEFTPDDEEHLCKFLWQATGNGGRGRKGINLYKRMVSMAEHADEHRWAKRHPPGSWRSRYKTHQKRLDKMIMKVAAETPEDVRQHFENNRGHGSAALEDVNDEVEPENDSELEPESEDEGPPRRRRRTAAIDEPRRARQRLRVASSSPPRASGSRLRHNAREKKAQPEGEEEVQEDELEEEEMPQIPDSLFDGPYDDPILAGDNTQTALVNISAERHQDSNEHGPSHSDLRGLQKTGGQADRTPASTQLSSLRPNVPARPEVPRKAAKRPRPQIPASPPPEKQEDYIPQSSPIRQSENGHSSVQRQQDRARVSDMTNNPTPRTIDTRRQPFSIRRLTLPRPIVAHTASPQASSSRVPLRQSMAQGRPAQGIYPVILPSHHIVPAMSTPVRRASVSSSDNDSSNFPVPGTKADSMKKYLREEHIRTPYTATPGTRAAAYLSQRM
ncbi:hypothetical protein D9619_005416 [Psilocybe cf. subviscida]|uniref:BRCT domain-containing protein n=1 Tax=Psilocybe cf. subviscida TaxID=2480587 RepID=A0A8H5BWP3_9AGAR|nr:hypothetical protein D9619_005416 [Psilocybe cf. subviscida]